MHRYYQKNLKKWHKTLNSYMNYISYELESLTGQSYDTLIQEIWTNYQEEMLERFPYIGGDAASGTKNLIGAYMFVSMGEVLKKYGVTTAQSGHLMILIYERQFKKIPSFLRSIMGKIFTNPRFLTKIFLKKDRKNALNAAQNPGSFETQTQIPPEKGYDFSYHNLVCPLADFAKKYGYEEYMPYLCNLDYVMFGILGAPLYREHTCFDDDYCDFKLKLSAKPMDYDPPVFTQANGYKQLTPTF